MNGTPARPPGKTAGRTAHPYFLHPCSYLPLTQVVPPGPWATPIPFFVLALPPLVVWVVVTPFELVWATAALPVLGLTAAALLGPCATVAPLVVLTVLLVWVVVTPFGFLWTTVALPVFGLVTTAVWPLPAEVINKHATINKTFIASPRLRLYSSKRNRPGRYQPSDRQTPARKCVHRRTVKAESGHLSVQIVRFTN